MYKTKYQLEVINRIRNLRIAHDMSQVELAVIIGVGNGQIGNIESSKYRHKYTLKQLYSIAIALNISINYILTGDDTPMTNDELIKALIKYDE